MVNPIKRSTNRVDVGDWFTETDCKVSHCRNLILSISCRSVTNINLHYLFALNSLLRIGGFMWMKQYPCLTLSRCFILLLCDGDCRYLIATITVYLDNFSLISSFIDIFYYYSYIWLLKLSHQQWFPADFTV